MNKIGSFLPKVLDSMNFIPSFQSYVSKVVSYGCSISFLETPPDSKIFVDATFPSFPTGHSAGSSQRAVVLVRV